MGRMEWGRKEALWHVRKRALELRNAVVSEYEYG